MYTVPFFWPRFNHSTTHTSFIVGGIISRGQHISRSDVKRALPFSVLALRTVTETLGSSREKAAGEKTGETTHKRSLRAEYAGSAVWQ